MNDPILQIDHLRLALTGNEILKGVSLRLEEGEYVSIIGPNGAGKTTLVKCAAGIHAQWTGSIRLAGKPIATYSPRQRAKLQGYVPQAEGRTVPFTVAEFVATGRYPHLSAFTTLGAADHAAIDAAIGRAGLDPLRHRPMNTLSGGERQMAFIAAALAQEAKLLLLDEPSTFLDYRHQAQVAGLLASARRERGIAVLAIHHDINTATACSDRIYAIKEGQNAFEGTASELADAAVLRAIYDTEFSTAPAPGRSIPFVMAGGAQ